MKAAHKTKRTRLIW